MFNRREQIALFFLAGSLLTGSGLALLDHHRPATLEEFQVIAQAVPVPQSVIDTGPVRLNTATAVQLQRLPTIGPKMAARILAYRQTHGPFTSLDDLQRVKGIGSSTLAKLRPLVVLEAPLPPPQARDR
ncbi:MAG: hypothetical protein GKR89_25420 [Candidatus Latescibacteria bacterium]|nr:hypothetical protein [Candidatus Latescibacterota bacterium]